MSIRRLRFVHERNPARHRLEETMPNLISRIEELMLTDTESPVRQSEYLRQCWETASDAERAKIDEALIAICGYSMSTLVKQIPEDTDDWD
jgi:hypothetical protein